MASPSATTPESHSAYIPGRSASSAPADGRKNGAAAVAAPPIPKTMRRWVVRNFTGPDGLEMEEVPMPEVGPNEVLVKLSAASLNYRDLVVARGQYPWPMTGATVPCSDGAGTVAAVGSLVAAAGTLAPGDAVATVMNGEHQFGPMDPRRHLRRVLGAGPMPGTLAEWAGFPAEYLIPLPRGLSMLEGSTLACAALTAWDALYGLELVGGGGKKVGPGDWVLTMGSGGVSCFAIQFAKAAGAKVIATTSSAEKAARLRALGADHVLNYREDPDWGAAAAALTADGGAGVDWIVEVGGATTLAQSLAAIRPGGVVSLVGFRGGSAAPEAEPRLLDMFFRFCVVRTCFVGPRVQYEAMNRAIEAVGLRPAVDEKVFGFEEAKGAFEYMETQKHFGKVCVKIGE